MGLSVRIRAIVSAIRVAQPVEHLFYMVATLAAKLALSERTIRPTWIAVRSRGFESALSDGSRGRRSSPTRSVRRRSFFDCSRGIPLLASWWRRGFR